MDVDKIFNAGGVLIPNPNYNKSTKNVQPKYITATDLDNTNPGSNAAIDMFYNATAEGDIDTRDYKDVKKYLDYGLMPNKYNKDTIDKQLYDIQDPAERYWNALKQTVVSEIALGTIKTIPELFDIITGSAFKSDGNYSNPVSRYLEELQEKYKENNPIFQDPNAPDIFHGAWKTSGWWASNIPSIASSLTLLVPGAGATKGLQYLSKISGLNKAVKFGRKSLLTKDRIDKIRKGEQLGKLDEFAIWANRKSTVTAANRMLESGITAATMRTLENYQEANQTYNEVYEDAYAHLRNMSIEDFQDFLDNHADELKNKNINPNDRNEVAKAIAKNAADKTFAIDYANLIFDVIQVNALRNPLKLSKNLRATAATNKANREAALFTGKSAEEITKLKANQKFADKAKNWFKDHSGAFAIWGAESTEGVEEAINYIAQQEGINYGQTLLDPENHPEIAFGDRLASYLKSPQLYESAFWGVLGGVAFQAGGSKLKQTYHGIVGNIKESKDTNETTQEKNNSNWKEKFETSENKRRVASINKRLTDYNTLSDRLKMIDDKDSPRNPFEGDVNDPTKPAAITSDIERDLIRQKAINEYLDGLAVDAADNGNYDTLLAYLRDENVNKALTDIGVIDGSTESVEKLINRMNNTVERYENNMIMLDGIMNTFEDVPFEYLQIIARDNTFADLAIEDIDNRIQNYKISAENNKKRFGKNLDESIDYASAVKLVTAASRLANLRARKNEIQRDEEFAKSIDGQNSLADINKEIKQINEYLNSDEFTNLTDKPSAFSSKLARVLWTNGMSLQGFIDSNGKFQQSNQTDAFIDFTTAVASKDMKALNEMLDLDFKTTDEDIISVFGDENGTYGQYEALGNDISTALDIKDGLTKRASLLNDDYSMISALELHKLSLMNQIANTTESINNKVNTIHNSLNKARKMAIIDAENTIFEIGKKYNYADVLSYVFNNDNSIDIEDSDKKSIDHAVEVLNLTTDSNRALAENLRYALLQANVIQQAKSALKDKEENLKNTTGQNQNLDTNDQVLNNPSTETINEQNEPLMDSQSDISGQTSSQPITLSQPEKVKVSSDLNGSINVNRSATDEEVEFELTETTNGDILLSPIKNKPLSDATKANTGLFEGYDKDLENVTVKSDINITYPILAKDANDNYYVKQKGKISYQIDTTNPSTGEGVNPSIIDSNSQNENITTKDEEILPVSSRNSNITVPEEEQVTTQSNDVLNDYNEQEAKLDEVRDEFNNLIKNRDKSKSIEDSIVEAEQIIIDKYKNNPLLGRMRDNIERQKRFIIARAKRKGLIRDAADVMLSTVIETPNGKYDYSEEYKKAVDAMIVSYCKEFGIREVNGKYYINLEDALRTINKKFDDKKVADLMFGALNSYLQLDEAKSKFIIKDNTNDPNFLNNVKKSVEQRIAEKIGNDQRVSIDRLFENPSPNFLKTFDSIQKGDNLQIDYRNGEISLLKNGVKIGTLPSPLIDSKTGAFYKYNNGWKTDVTFDGVKVVSNLRDIFEHLLFEESEYANDIANAITELNYGKPNEKRRKELVNLVYDKLVNDLKLIENGYISSSADKEDVVSYIEKLWKYFDTAGETPELRNAAIALSLDKWFDKVYNSYSSINSAINNLNEDSNSIEITVSNISNGEIILNVPADSQNKGGNYYNFTPSNEAIGSRNEVQLGIVNPKNQSEVITTDGKVIPYSLANRSGVPVLVIPNKNGIINVISGTSVSMTDISVKGDVREIIDAIKTEFNNVIDSYIKDGNYDTIYNFFHKLFYSTNKSGLAQGISSNTGLLWGVTFRKGNTNEQGFSILTKSGLAFNIHNNENKTFDFRRRGETLFNKNRQINNPDNAKIFKELLNELLNETTFNISTDYINSDSTKRGLNGFGVIDRQGNFNIYIPNSANPDKSFSKTYSNFKDAVLKGGLIRVNTHQENDSNYRHKGENQRANQILEVSITRKATSPVEGLQQDNTNQSSTTGSSNVENILKNNNINNKAEVILSDLVTEAQLKSLKKLNLLPKKLIFDESLNEQDENGNYVGDNAFARLSTGETFIGRRWLDMFNEEGEFGTSIPGEARKQAIRKLIHEQLHHRLKTLGRKKHLDKIAEIYDEFEKSLENASEEVRNNISKYLFKDGKTPRNIALEEFLVESITSEELVNYLNSVDSTFDKGKVKQTLWRKIINLINDIFGWTVKEGSLREKELFELQDVLSKVREGIKNIPTPSKVETKTESIQTTLNFKEDINTEEIKTKTDEISEDDFNFDNMFDDVNDTRGSSITENEVAQSSISEFTDSLPIDIQADFVASVATGDISIACR